MNLLPEKKYRVPSQNFVEKMFCEKKVTKLPDLTVTVYSVWLGEGGLYGRPTTAGLLRSVCDQIQNLQNCLPAPRKKPKRGGASNRFAAATNFF